MNDAKSEKCFESASEAGIRIPAALRSAPSSLPPWALRWRCGIRVALTADNGTRFHRHYFIQARTPADQQTTGVGAVSSRLPSTPPRAVLHRLFLLLSLSLLHWLSTCRSTRCLHDCLRAPRVIAIARTHPQSHGDWNFPLATDLGGGCFKPTTC